MLSRRTEAAEAGLSRLAQPEVYQKYRVPLLDGGMRADIAPVDMAPNQSPDIENLLLLGNVLVVDTGYGQFGKVIGGAALFGTPQLFQQIFNLDGTSTDLLVTTATVYRLNLTFMQWEIVPLAAFRTNSPAVSAGGSSITLNSVTGISTGTFLGLPLDDGEQLPVTVTGVVGLVVSFTPTVPAGRSVPNNSNICIGIALNGTLIHQVIAEPFSPKNWTIFTNTVDPLFYFDGTFMQLLTGLPTGTTCRFLLTFHESLFLFNTTENGQALPQRVRMSDQANPQAWTPGSGSSIAAIYDLLDTDDFIISASIIGPYLIVFRDTTIMQGQYLGQLNQIMFWQYMIFNEGIISTNAQAGIGALTEFVGNGGVYTYDGVDYTLESEGDAIFLSSFSAVGDINSSFHDTIFTQYVPDYDEFWIFYPAGTSASLPNKMWRQSLEKRGWFRRTFANEFISAAPYLPVATTTWASATGTWQDHQLAWNTRAFLANVASIVLCAGDTNLVYVYDYKTTTDAGAAISWTLQTKDIDTGDQMNRWDSVRVYGRGTATCEVSVDGGVTFTVIGVFVFGTSEALRILTFQAVSPYIRFRLSGSDPTFALHWMEVWYLKESEW